MIDSPYLLPATRVGDFSDAKRIGRKAFILSLLIQNGAPVPPGISLTRDALRRMLSRKPPDSESPLSERLAAVVTGLSSDSGADAFLEVEKKAARLLEQTPLPEDVRLSLAAALRYLEETRPSESYLVRSSSISIPEDSVRFTVPGLFASVGGCRGLDELCAAVCAVWRSQWSAEAIRFRVLHGFAPEDIDMGVFIQPERRARVSGTCYTRAPGTPPFETGAKYEIVAGPGASGRWMERGNTPEWFRLDKEDGVVLHRPGSFDGSPLENQLDLHSLKKLVDLVEESVSFLEKHTRTWSPFGYDVEWALKDGWFTLFQVRPVPPPPGHPLTVPLEALFRLAPGPERMQSLLEIFQAPSIPPALFEKTLEDWRALEQALPDFPETEEARERLLECLRKRIEVPRTWVENPQNFLSLFASEDGSIFETAGMEAPALFSTLLDALAEARTRPVSADRLGLVIMNLSKLERSEAPAAVKRAFTQMLFRLPVSRFDARGLYNTLEVSFPLFAKSDPLYCELLGRFLEKRLASWDGIEPVDPDDLPALFDQLWKIYFRERPRLHDVFRNSLRALFLGVPSGDGALLSKLRAPRLADLWIPVKLDRRFEGLSRPVFGENLAAAVSGVMNDPRFPSDYETDRFFDAFTRRGRQRIFRFPPADEPAKRDAVRFRIDRELPGILADPACWKNRTLFEIKRVLVRLANEGFSDAVERNALEGVRALLRSGGSLPGLFYEEIREEILEEDWQRAGDFPNGPFADLSALKADFERYAERALRTGRGLRSNVFDLRDALLDAGMHAESGNPAGLEHALDAVRTILSRKLFLGERWRTPYDNRHRPPLPDTIAREAPWLFGEANEAVIERLIEAHEMLVPDPFRHFPLVELPWRELLARLSPEKAAELEILFYSHIGDLFLTRDVAGRDVDDTVRLANRLALRAAAFDPAPEIRLARRHFLERIRAHLPGSFRIGTDWRILHDRFEDLDTEVPRGYPEIRGAVETLLIDIHNVLHPDVLEKAKRLRADIEAVRNDPGWRESMLPARLEELVSWLERLYEPFAGKAVLTGPLPAPDETLAAKLRSPPPSKEPEKGLPLDPAREFERIRDASRTDDPETALDRTLRFQKRLESILSNPDFNLPSGDGPFTLHTEERLYLIEQTLVLENLEATFIARLLANPGKETGGALASWLVSRIAAMPGRAAANTLLEKALAFQERLAGENAGSPAAAWTALRRELAAMLPDSRDDAFTRLLEPVSFYFDRAAFPGRPVPLSPGTASGRARVHKDMLSSASLESWINDPEKGIGPNDVLVLREIPRILRLSPDRLPAGLIVENGSIASHAAATLRQASRRIPAVVVPGIFDFVEQGMNVAFEVDPKMERVRFTISLPENAGRPGDASRPVLFSAPDYDRLEYFLNREFPPENAAPESIRSLRAPPRATAKSA
jgi:hypothetical protein